MTNENGRNGRRTLRRESGLIRKAIFETLERRQYLTGLPIPAVVPKLDSPITFERPAAVTVMTSFGAAVTDDPILQGPVQLPFSNGQPKDELIAEDGSRLVTGTVGGNWPIARYTQTGGLDPTFGVGGKVMIDLGGSADQALNLNVRPDGKVLAMGLAGASDTNYQFAFVRLKPDGTLDTTFGDSGKLLTGIGRAPKFGCVTILMMDDPR